MDYGAMVATAQNMGISPPSRQGKFEGSDRWVRSRLIKMLIKTKSLSFAKLQKQFGGNQLKRIIIKMEREKILVRKDKRISLS